MAYTDILSGASLGTNLVKTAYDRMVEFNLRSMPWYRAIADKRPVAQTQPGSSVVFNFYADLAVATSTLTETTDPTPVAVPATTTVSVTLNEYGNVVLPTRKLRLFTLSDVDPAIADIISFNMVDSLDSVVRDVVRVGTLVVRENGGALKAVGAAGSALASVAATDTFKSRDIRAAVSNLRKNSVMPRVGNLYVGYIHPDVSYDLRSETTNADWRTPHAYSAAGNVWAGMIGEYEGALWIETPRAYSASDGASSAVVHRTLLFGKQALAECVAEEPHVVIGPVVDTLMRFRPLGWYGVLGWAIYRNNSIVRIETSTSLA